MCCERVQKASNKQSNGTLVVTLKHLLSETLSHWVSETHSYTKLEAHLQPLTRRSSVKLWWVKGIIAMPMWIIAQAFWTVVELYSRQSDELFGKSRDRLIWFSTSLIFCMDKHRVSLIMYIVYRLWILDIKDINIVKLVFTEKL